MNDDTITVPIPDAIRVTHTRHGWWAAYGWRLMSGVDLHPCDYPHSHLVRRELSTFSDKVFDGKKDVQLASAVEEDLAYFAALGSFHHPEENWPSVRKWGGMYHSPR